MKTVKIIVIQRHFQHYQRFVWYWWRKL